MSYRVKTVCEMLGIPRPTLLAWERRYRILDPVRSPAGHRMYSDADVALLRRLKRRVDDGYAIGEAVALERAAPGLGGAQLAAEPAPELEGWRRRPVPAAPAGAPELLEALLAFDRAAADRRSPGVRQLPFQQAIDEVYLPMLREVGARWADGRISVASEHFVSGWVREQLLAMVHALGGGPAGGPNAVCALAPGERHDLGLMAVSVGLMLAGWRVTWLGADVPVDELCDLIAAERPQLVCLSTTFGAGPASVRAWGRQVRRAAPAETVVALGGPCTRGGDGAPLAIPGVVVCDTADELLAAVRAGRTP